MVIDIDVLEQQRLVLQAELDEQRTLTERNRLGQFATPTELALDILKCAKTFFPPDEKVRFLDPAIGIGAFYSAFRKVFPKSQIVEALGFEVDSHYGIPASRLWRKSGLSLNISDFTDAEPFPRYNLVVCNPPYVRHHHLGNAEKERLQSRTLKTAGIKFNGLAGFYCHFLCIAHAWMAPGGLAGWLIPSEFMDVNYGRSLKRYLLDRVTLLHIHRFDPNDVQFADALVSSAVVWFRNLPPPKDNTVTFTFGGSLLEPRVSRIVPARILAHDAKWTRFPVAESRNSSSVPTIADLFYIKRGLATGDNSYFILSQEAIKERGLPVEVFTPILPSPRYVPNDEIVADQDGNPEIDRRLFLLNTRLSREEIRKHFPSLFTYLEEGEARGLQERYLCRHRSPWYSQEHRPAPPIVCTYLGRSNVKRGRPFRFILNNSKATVANVYLAMYPRPRLKRALDRDPKLIRSIWAVLNQIASEQLLGEGRVYGGGLHKLEPRELGNVNASSIVNLLPDFQDRRASVQMEMFG
jgi:hypothetical protein